MGIGATSPLWRKLALRSLASTWICRKAVTPDGVFRAYVSGGSSLKVLDPRGLRVEQVHQRFIRDWIAPDATVWDIGANLGLFALPAALRARRGRVYAFEPDVELAANLLRTIRLSHNKQLDISLFCLAVSDLNGTANFQISAISRAMNKLEAVGTWHNGQVKALETRSVATLTIDTLAKDLSPPAVIKIDVEGAEVKVLEGGRRTISQFRPVMLIEGPSELWNPMGSFLRQHDYVMLDGAEEHQQPLDHPVWDTIAIPMEKFLRNGRTA
jgi:FkbM family methyltransferase